ncbi:phage tail sheath family protein [Pukyongia salina]|uniref:Phage tail sheath family protein n=1 Tax=Pukyongia salina TaxID=2094025 RepID=A0A2S0HUT3_9FLAO|nr:phage tail sheath C-terminal domain-containing protein [Pukyongia salina]AVI50441.1 phage tail sheath family protein [Pukyongia salina]
MSTIHKTPGVYIQELDAFGNAVVPVETAVPVFIGYTQNTSYGGESLLKQPIKISSFADFLTYFGSEAPHIKFDIAEDPAEDPDFSFGDKNYAIQAATVKYRLYGALKFFYANGGADCFVMSIGAYKDGLTKFDSTTPFTDALTLLKKESEPTMVVIPDLVEFEAADAYTIQNAMINHCGDDMPSRVALLDIPGGYEEKDIKESTVDKFRSGVSPINAKSNSYAAAYYPWLHTTIFQESDFSYKNLTDDAFQVLDKALRAEFNVSNAPVLDSTNKNGQKIFNKARDFDVKISYLTAQDYKGDYDAKKFPLFKKLGDDQAKERKMADDAIRNQSSFYTKVLDHVQRTLNLMPPSAGIAGVFTSVDSTEGVWKAPANVAMQSVIAPAIKINHDMQEDLNVPLDGKSVCAIRAFKGMGNMVWGARTLDGNSNDWRYINVRRTLIFLEQSIKQAAKAYVFAPNDANTWVNVQSMISNFLTGVWKQGGLVGPKPADAYSVSVGLGKTMTNDDIQNGRMIVAVKVAVSHPAEFIEITFQQEMQKA